MEQRYIDNAKIFKALSDPKRLRIVDMLSCGELCACKILEEFNITQPTLSHDMSLLCDTGIVVARREGKWMHYSLNREVIAKFKIIIQELFEFKTNCICMNCEVR